MLISLEISEVYLASWRELKDYDVRGGGGGVARFACGYPGYWK